MRATTLYAALGLAFAAPACSGNLVQPGDEVQADIATIELTTNTPTIGLGQSAGFVVDARSSRGDAILDVSYSWQSSNPDVLVVDESGRGIAMGLGTAEVTASAGGVTSNAATVTVIDNPNLVDPSVRVSPGIASLNVGQSIALHADARGTFGEAVEAPLLTWTATPEGIVSIDEEGVVTANAIGEVELHASYEGFSSPVVRISVITESEYAAVGWLRPSGENARAETLDVVAQTHFLAAGTTTGPNPVAPADAALVVDGTPIADLAVGSGADYNRVTGSVSIAELSEGAHEMWIEATVDGRTARSEVRVFEKVAPGAGWENLAEDLRGIGDVAEAVVDVQGDEVLVMSSRCQRECNTEAFVWNENSSEWDRVEYARQLWDEERTGEGENQVVTYTAFVDETARLVTPPKFVGWGWTPTITRDIDLARDTPRLAAYSMLEARTAFNVDDGLERFWHDCYASQWNENGGFDGEGGWELLAPNVGGYPSGSDYIYNLPNPMTVLDESLESSMWQLPQSVEEDRAEDCASPQVAVQGDDIVMAYVSTPVPQTAWGLEASRWTGGEWEAIGQRLSIPYDGAALTELVVDRNELLIAAVANGEEGQVHRLSASGAWTPLEEGSLALRALELSDSGGLYGAGGRGDVLVYAGDDERWSQVGDVLDSQPWARTESLSLLAHEGELFAAWAEGPSGDRNLYVSQWIGEEATWRLVGGGPVEASVDEDALGISLSIDASGRLVLAYLEPVLQDDSTYSNRVRIRRTQESVMP